MRIKGEKSQVTNIRSEIATIIKDDTVIKRIIRKYYKQLDTPELENLGETDQILKYYKQDERNNPNYLINIKEIEFII